MSAIVVTSAVNHRRIGRAHKVARPFILLQEIELALRSLIEVCAPDDRLKECIERALAKSYEGRKKEAPSKLKDMTFEDYRAIIVCNENWSMFEGTLGHNRDLISAKLERMRIIRNEVFHFRSEISVLDYQHLATTREELLGKLRRALSRKEPANV